jgi:hypothetical protein
VVFDYVNNSRESIISNQPSRNIVGKNFQLLSTTVLPHIQHLLRFIPTLTGDPRRQTVGVVMETMEKSDLTLSVSK